MPSSGGSVRRELSVFRVSRFNRDMNGIAVDGSAAGQRQHNPERYIGS
jgi:hypothetical protein